MFGGIFSSSYGLLGIDIGSRAMRLLQLRSKGGALNVVGAGEVLLTDSPHSNGQARDLRSRSSDLQWHDSLSDRLRAAFTAGGFTGRRCVVSLPKEDVHTQAVRLPRMSDAELRQAARWEAAERFSLDPDAFEVDFIRTGAQSGSPLTVDSSQFKSDNRQLKTESPHKDEVLLIAASHEVINAWLRPILNAGLRPVAIDTHFSAIARFFSRRLRREADRQHAYVVLEIGCSGSTILILRGDEIAFCKPLSIGGRDLDHAVADHLQLDLASAAELRASRVGLSVDGSQSGNALCQSPDPATERAIYEATRPLLGEIVKELTLCLRYFGVTFRGRPPSHIILTGGECHEPHLAEHLSSSCKLGVRFDDEDETLSRRLIGPIASLLHRPTGTGPAPAWTVAAGLSIRELRARRVRKPVHSDHPGLPARSEASPQAPPGAGASTQRTAGAVGRGQADGIKPRPGIADSGGRRDHSRSGPGIESKGVSNERSAKERPMSAKPSPGRIGSADRKDKAA